MFSPAGPLAAQAPTAVHDIAGTAGADTLHGGKGRDHIDGGDGVDTLVLVSFTDIAFGHRRAEFLIRVTSGTPARWAAEATPLALDHAAGALRLERLVACFCPDNRAALSAALGMGFREEGVLRGHVRDAASGRRSDLLVAAVLLDEAWRTTTARLRSRLLDRVARARSTRGIGWSGRSPTAPAGGGGGRTRHAERRLGTDARRTRPPHTPAARARRATRPSTQPGARSSAA